MKSPNSIRTPNKIAVTQESVQTRNMRTPQMDEVLQLKSSFQRTVMMPVRVIEDIWHNKMPQKCILHNNNYTLYCEQDRKPLCASCMYQNNAHRAHKVMALNSSLQNLQRDSHRYEGELEKLVDSVTGLVQHVNKGIKRLQQDFPHLLWKIEEQYQNLHEFLIAKQKQHVNQIRYYKDKIKYQHGALSIELNKIAVYIEQKISVYSSKNDTDVILPKRNIYDTLRQTSKLIGDELKNIPDQTLKLNFQIFGQIQDLMLGKFANLFAKEKPRQAAKPKRTSMTPKSKKLKSDSKQKISYSPSSKSRNISPQTNKNTRVSPARINDRSTSQKRTNSPSNLKPNNRPIGVPRKK